MTDAAIEEIYLAALDSKARPIPVHIFPMRMEGRGYAKALAEADPEVRRLWKSLAAAWSSFERVRSVPRWKLVKGEYVVGR